VRAEQTKRSIVEEGGVQALVHLSKATNVELQRNIVNAFCDLSARSTCMFDSLMSCLCVLC